MPNHSETPDTIYRIRLTHVGMRVHTVPWSFRGSWGSRGRHIYTVSTATAKHKSNYLKPSKIWDVEMDLTTVKIDIETPSQYISDLFGGCQTINLNYAVLSQSSVRRVECLTDTQTIAQLSAEKLSEYFDIVWLLDLKTQTILEKYDRYSDKNKTRKVGFAKI
jgi:hypothetical protein